MNCPECGWDNYLVWPSYKNCQTCLRLRIERLERAWAMTDGNGRPKVGVGAGGDRKSIFACIEAGPAEVPVSAGHAPATGH